MGGMLLMGSTANLDTGKRHQGWHTFCASHFFVFTVLALLYNTLLYFVLYCKTTKVSLPNLCFKLLLMVAFFIQLFINFKYGASLDAQASDAKSEVGVTL